MSSDGVNTGRRQFLTAATSAVGVAGVGGENSSTSCAKQTKGSTNATSVNKIMRFIFSFLLMTNVHSQVRRYSDVTCILLLEFLFVKKLCAGHCYPWCDIASTGHSSSAVKADD